MINRLGIRMVTFISGAAMALGLLGCTVITSPTWFCVLYGLLFGTGGNFGFMANSLIVPQYFEQVNCLPDNYHMEVHFYKDILPGYLWIFPLPNGQANVGMGILSSEVGLHEFLGVLI